MSGLVFCRKWHLQCTHQNFPGGACPWIPLEQSLTLLYRPHAKISHSSIFKSWQHCYIDTLNPEVGILTVSYEKKRCRRQVFGTHQLFRYMYMLHTFYFSCLWFIFISLKTFRGGTKMVPELVNINHTDRHKMLNLPTLKYRRKRDDLIHVFKILNGHYDINWEDFFTLDTNRTHNTRGHSKKWLKTYSHVQ